MIHTLWFLKGKPNVSLNRQIMEHCGCGHGLRHRREDECWWKQKGSGKFGSFLLTYCSFYMFFPVIWLQYSNASRHPLTVRQKTHSKSYLHLPSPGDAILHLLLWVLSWYIWKYPQYCQMPHIKLWYGGFLKWWYPTTMGSPTKNDHFGVFWGCLHLRKHPYNPFSKLSVYDLWPSPRSPKIWLRISCLSSCGCCPCTACADGSNQTRNSGCGERRFWRKNLPGLLKNHQIRRELNATQLPRRAWN